MAKRFGRPSAQYRYEHYDPRLGLATAVLTGLATAVLTGLATAVLTGLATSEFGGTRHPRLQETWHRRTERLIIAVMGEPGTAVTD
jgi:hypothetical protein